MRLTDLTAKIRPSGFETAMLTVPKEPCPMHLPLTHELEIELELKRRFLCFSISEGEEEAERVNL